MSAPEPDGLPGTRLLAFARAIGAWAGAAFLAGPLAITFMKQSGEVSPVVLAARSMQIAMVALAVMLVALAGLALRGARAGALAVPPLKPQMSAMQSVGLSGVIIIGLFAVDRLLGQYQAVMQVVLLLLSSPSADGPSGQELAGRSEGIIVLFGAGVVLTLCLLVFGIGLWRASTRYAPTTSFTWTSRAALVVALAGSVWHTTAAFEIGQGVSAMVEWVEGTRPTPPRLAPREPAGLDDGSS